MEEDLVVFENGIGCVLVSRRERGWEEAKKTGN